MARQKITDAVELAGGEIPDLDEREIEFATLLLRGVNATDAYIQSHDAKNWKRTSAQVSASRLANSEKIQLWLRYARLALLTEGRVSLEQHIRDLDSLKQLAVDSGNIGAAVQAEQLKGKASGLYIERTEDITQRTTDSDLITALRQMFGDEIAESLAQKMGATEH